MHDQRRDLGTPANRAERIREALRAAFPARPIPEWPGGKQGSMEELACRKTLRGKTWNQVVASVLSTTCSDCFLIIPSHSLQAYYLPAFVDAVLLSFPHEQGGVLFLNLVETIANGSLISSLQNGLTTTQCYIIADFLQLLADVEEAWSEDAARYHLAAEIWASPR